MLVLEDAHRLENARRHLRNAKFHLDRLFPRPLNERIPYDFIEMAYKNDTLIQAIDEALKHRGHADPATVASKIEADAKAARETPHGPKPEGTKRQLSIDQFMQSASDRQRMAAAENDAALSVLVLKALTEMWQYLGYNKDAIDVLRERVDSLTEPKPETPATPGRSPLCDTLRRLHDVVVSAAKLGSGPAWTAEDESHFADLRKQIDAIDSTTPEDQHESVEVPTTVKKGGPLSESRELTEAATIPAVEMIRSAAIALNALTEPLTHMHDDSSLRDELQTQAANVAFVLAELCCRHAELTTPLHLRDIATLREAKN